MFLTPNVEPSGYVDYMSNSGHKIALIGLSIEYYTDMREAGPSDCWSLY